MRGITFLGLLVAAVLSGCVENGVQEPDPSGVRPPPGTLLCLPGPVCNYEATVDPDERQANELSIAANPLDPLNMIATGKDYTPEEAGDCTRAGVYTTLDGGATWHNQNVPGSPWKMLNDPTAAPEANDFTRFWCVTDPVVTFGPDGTAYWTVMPYQCDAVSGSKTGRGVLPMGGFNDWFWTCSSMYVLVSRDGGMTWPTWQEVAFGPRLEHDKQWIAAAPNGNVLLCWDRSDNVAGTGTAADQLDGDSVMVCAVSTDEGRSWSDYETLNPTWQGFFPAVDYDANNTAWAVYVDFTDTDPDTGANRGRILVSQSADGLSWSQPVVVGPYTLPKAGGEYGWPVLRGSDFRALTIPLIAVDRSAGPYGGSIYAVWFDHTRGEGDVYVSYSRDQGATWSTPAKPHDDDPAKKADQFYPAISVGPDGIVDVSWWDRRDDPDNHLFHVYHAYSKDGGATWSENLRVSEHASDEQYSHHQNGMIFLGDYRDQESTTLGAHLVWVDTRHDKADVFVAVVQR